MGKGDALFLSVWIIIPFLGIIGYYSEKKRWLGNKRGEKRKNRCKSGDLRNVWRWTKADDYI